MAVESPFHRDFLTRREALALVGGAALAATGCDGMGRERFVEPSKGANTKGGDEARVLRVTTLAPTGPGSLTEACKVSEPRKIVFDVGGVIDLGMRKLKIPFPYLTIAGETAPEPGITLIRGGISVEADHVVIRHLRVRTGSAGAAPGSGWDCDCINVYASRHVIVDHCSLSWGTDEVLSASGPPFRGESPAEWRRNTSSNIVFSNNLIAEGLSHSTHSEGEHSKGALVNSNVTDILFLRNMFASNVQRNPLFNGGTSGAVINNYIFNPGTRAIMLGAVAGSWGTREIVPGKLAIIGNVLEPGPSSSRNLAMVSVTKTGLWQLYLKDNIVWYSRFGSRPAASPQGSNVRVLEKDMFPNYPAILPSEDVRKTVLQEVGARPSSRDANDRRLITDAEAGHGAVINSEEDVGGYPR